MQINLRDVDGKLICLYKSTLVPRVGEKITLVQKGEYRVLEVNYNIAVDVNNPTPTTWIDITVDYLEVQDE